MKYAFSLLLVTLLVTDTNAQTPTVSLQGAWQVVEIVTPGPNGPTSLPGPPGLYIFTAKHYSIAFLTSNAPRPDLPANVQQATAAELLASWLPYASNSGQYEITGDQVTMRPSVAKNPSVMKAGASYTNTFKIEGDILSLTTVRSVNGPVTNGATVKLKRVE